MTVSFGHFGLKTVNLYWLKKEIFSKFKYTDSKFIYKGVRVRIISMKQVRDIVKLHSDMGFSIRKIQGATGVAKSTVTDYIICKIIKKCRV